MPKKIQTKRITEVLGYDRDSDGDVVVVFRARDGTEYGVKLPLARLSPSPS